MKYQVGPVSPTVQYCYYHHDQLARPDISTFFLEVTVLLTSTTLNNYNALSTKDTLIPRTISERSRVIGELVSVRHRHNLSDRVLEIQELTIKENECLLL